MSISLPPDIEEYIQGEVASGRFESTDAVLYEAINTLKERERQRAELRKDLQAAVEQIENGDYIEYDRESLRDFFEELKQEARRAHQQSVS